MKIGTYTVISTKTKWQQRKLLPEGPGGTVWPFRHNKEAHNACGDNSGGDGILDLLEALRFKDEVETDGGADVDRCKESCHGQDKG